MSVEILAEAEPEYDREDYLNDLRGLVLSNGHPYVLIELSDPATGKVELSSFGIDPAVVPAALRDIADQYEAGQ